MSLEAIVEHILDKAKTEAQQIVLSAQKERDAILEQAKAEAGEIYQEYLQKEKVVYEAQSQKVIVNSRLEYKKKILETKQGIINTVFERLGPWLHRDKFKKQQITPDRVHEVSQDIDFYLKQIRLEYEVEIANILFAKYAPC